MGGNQEILLQKICGRSKWSDADSLLKSIRLIKTSHKSKRPPNKYNQKKIQQYC